MQTITITVKNKKVLPKLYSILKQFNEKEIVVTIEPEITKKQKRKNEKKYSNEYIKKHWRKFIYTSVGDLSIDDDEFLREYYGEKLLKDYENTF